MVTVVVIIIILSKTWDYITAKNREDHKPNIIELIRDRKSIKRE